MKSKTEITVRNYHTDGFGHVNHARYLEFLEEARWRHLEAKSRPAKTALTPPRHVVTEIHIHYGKSAHVGDILRIETEFGERSEKTLSVNQTVFLGTSGEIVLSARISNVFLKDSPH